MRRALVLLLAAILIVSGAVLGWRAMHGSEPAAAPVPSRTFDISSPTPDTRTSADVAVIPDDPAPTASSGSSSSAKTDAATTMRMSPDRMEAERIYIPTLGIYASLTAVSFSDGTLTIPKQPWRVGIDVDSAPLDADVGTTLLAGHVDLSGTPGALVSLAEAEPGALVYVTDEDGRRSTFVTTGLQRYSKVSLPRSVFDVEGARQLAIVTCGGPIMTIDGERHYRDNVVLTAVPARS